MTTFDPTKPVQQRCGRPATILVTDLKNLTHPIAARITTPSGEEVVGMFRTDGRYGSCSPMDYDLVNTPRKTVKITRWENVYPPEKAMAPCVHRSREEADNAAFPSRIACIELTGEMEEQ